MESSDVENDTSTEETILYELGVLEDWPQEPEIFTRVNKEPSPASLVDLILSTGQRSAWALTRLTGLGPRPVSQSILPKSHAELNSLQMAWKLAVTEDGCFVAIVQDHTVEIRSVEDDFSKPISSWSVQRDVHPQWRCVAWSPDNHMLAISHSSGSVVVYDIMGAAVCNIADETASRVLSSSDLSLAICALIFKSTAGKSGLSPVLLVVNYLGSLSSYLIRGDGHCQLEHMFNFGSHYHGEVSSVLYVAHHSLLLVAGSGEPHDQTSSPTATQQGLTAWRLLSGTPHYKLVTDYEDDLRMATRNKQQLVKKLKRYSSYFWSSQNQDGVYKLSLSPDGNAVAALHHSGALSIWDVPSLRHRATWPTEEQPGYNEVNQEIAENPKKRKDMKDHLTAFFLTDLAWWSNEAVILARANGAVTVSSAATLSNLLGASPEWFSPVPRVTSGLDGEGFLALECECKYGAVRRGHRGQEDTAADDDDYEDSDDELDATFAIKTKKYLRAVMYFVTDSEKFQPPRKRPKLITRKYRLTSLRSTTPEELYSRKIAQEEYGNALSLAKAYQLDSDLVYQQQWRKSHVSVATIQDYLSKISKRSWVLRECLERVPDDYDAMVELLHYGLRGTDLQALITIGQGQDGGRFILCEAVDEDDLAPLDPYDPVQVEAAQEARDGLAAERDELLQQVDWNNLSLDQKELCRARLRLLQFTDRLHTYEAILGGMHTAVEKYDKVFFEKFRTDSMVELALDYARACDARALGILMKYHSKELTQHRLAILSNFPETFSPLEYRDLLPRAGCAPDDPEVLEWDRDCWRDEDWVELSTSRHAVHLGLDDGSFLYEDEPDMVKFKGSELSLEQVEQWYQYRACQIESLSLQVDNALELLLCGQERHIQGLEELHDDLMTMETLVYEGLADTKITFKTLQAMKTIEKLGLLMSCSSDEMYSKNLMRWLCPFLKRCEARHPGSSRVLLAQHLVDMARGDLTRPLKVFEASRADLLQRVIDDEEELLTMALDCIYACQRKDQLSLSFSILECLPQRGFGRMSERFTELHNRVDQLECHLSAAEILERNRLPQTIAVIRDTQKDLEETTTIFIKLSRAAANRSVRLKEKEWEALLKDLLALKDKAYRMIEDSAVYKIFVESLLCSGCHENINMAGKLLERSAESAKEPNYTPVADKDEFLHEKVAYVDAVQLVISAAQEYFDSAHTLTHPSMDLARSCLSLIADRPPQVSAELDLIEALALLEGFGVNMLPMQVRMSQDRLVLVQKAIDAKSFTYKNSQRLLRLGRLLAVAGETEKERDGRVLQLVTRAALNNKDNTTAYEMCTQLMEADFGPIWKECKDLAQSEDFPNIQAKSELLAFAVTHCDAEKMGAILQARCLLETQLLYERLQSQLSDRSSQSPTESPFSASGAIQQTKNILSSTDRVTRSVLSTVSDGKWWKRAVASLHTSPDNTRLDEMDDGNVAFDKQGSHPFYLSSMDTCYSNKNAANYSGSGMGLSDRQGLSFNEGMLRMALLKQCLSDCGSADNQVLVQLARDNMAQDALLGLGYLMALTQPLEAEACFKDLPKTAISLQLAMYYYAVQLCSRLKPGSVPHRKDIYAHEPNELTQRILAHIKWRTEQEGSRPWPDGCAALVERLIFYNETYIDLTQAQLLDTLNRGIDLERFSADKDYKKETILGLAMSMEDDMYGLAVSLAERHSIPLWDVHMAHLESLFDSGLTTDEIANRVGDLGILSTLKSNPDEFVERMTRYVYPSIAGNDHAMLLYYFSLLNGCSLPGAISPDTHCKLVKKISSAAPDLDYTHLTDGKHRPLDVIRPVLTSSNINAMAKLAGKIPDKDGVFLQPSIVYCAWAIEFFWANKPSATNSAGEWLRCYESCSEFLQKMVPEDLINFIDGVVFVPAAMDSMPVDVRSQMVKRALKYSRQQGKKKKAKDDSAGWDDVIRELQKWAEHLDHMSHPAIVALTESDDVLQEEYSRQFDISRSNPDQVNELMLSMVLDGQELDLVESVRSVVGSAVWPLSRPVQHAFQLLTDALRVGEEKPIPALEGRDPMDTMTSLVTQVSQHMLCGGKLVTLETVMGPLRVFCADTTVPVSIRLDLLHLLEKTFELSDEDLVLLNLYRTRAVVSSEWPHRTLEETDVVSEEARQALFNSLLSASTHLNQFTALVKLLSVWPILASSQCKEQPVENNWCRLLCCLVTHCKQDSSPVVMETVKELAESDYLSPRMVENVHSVLLDHHMTCTAIKVLLLLDNTALHQRAVHLLNSHSQVAYDDELARLFLSRHLASAITNTHLFPVIVSLLLDTQPDAQDLPDYLRPQIVAEQLYEAGFTAEAGSLMAQARGLHPSLRTFDTVLGMLHKWFQK